MIIQVVYHGYNCSQQWQCILGFVLEHKEMNENFENPLQSRAKLYCFANFTRF